MNLGCDFFLYIYIYLATVAEWLDNVRLYFAFCHLNVPNLYFIYVFKAILLCEKCFHWIVPVNFIMCKGTSLAHSL